MMNYINYLDLNREDIKQKALERRENMILSTDVQEEMEGLKGGKIEATVSVNSLDALVVLPYLEKLNELNPKVTYNITVAEGEEVPSFKLFNAEGEEVGTLTHYPDRFKKRIKGLDEEDTNELIERYRRGYYNTEVVEGLLKFLR